MMITHSRLRFRRWVAGLLLAVYGSAGVLGYGLHAVWECEHHGHAHADAVAHSHSHDHGHACHHHHDHVPVIADSGCVQATVDLAVDACPICEFLVQAQTPFVMEFTTACIGPTFLIHNLSDSPYVAPLSNVSTARGPPLS